MRRRRQLAVLLVLLGAALLCVAAPVAAAGRPQQHCVVVPSAATRARAPAGNVSVVVPALRCDGQGSGGGSDEGLGSQPGGGSGSGSARGAGESPGGTVPFTGWDLRVSLEIAGTLLLAGGLLIGMGRRRLRTT